MTAQQPQAPEPPGPQYPFPASSVPKSPVRRHPSQVPQHPSPEFWASQSPIPQPSAPRHPSPGSSAPESGVPWPEVWAWLGGRLAVVGRGLALFGLAASGLVMLAALAAVVGLPPALALHTLSQHGPRSGAATAILIWIFGCAVVGPLLLLWMRSVARLTRRLADRWCEVPIAEPYLPKPWADGGKRGPRRWLRWLLGDPATWRDLLWVTVDGIVGWLWALLPAGMLALGLVAVVAPYASLGLRFLIIAAAAGTLWACPRLLRGYGHFAHSMLAPTKEAELVLRVRQLAETRSEAIDTSAAEIRRIERDLHDGAQARLVAMGMTLDAAGQIIDTNPDAARALLFEARDASVKALAELRDLVRGIHPPVLADRGLTDAIKALALDTPMRIHVESDLHGRASAPVESAAYFAISELLANVSKHAEARQTWIDIRHTDGMLRIGVTDNGHGGADPSHGSGLRGIERRLASFDGILAVSSPPGGPTAVTMEIPCELSLPKTSSS
jgi:signal transduction histidine kinase